MVRIGSCVTEPFTPSTIPARSYKVASSLYRYPGYPLRLGISPLEEETSRMASAKEVISVRMTRMCIFFSNARYSAAVSATFGVIRRSTTGSLARFRNIATWFATPLSSKVLRKKSATSCLTPIAANTMAKSSLVPPPREACFTICAASWSCGRPLPEKIGSFCPRISVVSPSIAEIPVRI